MITVTITFTQPSPFNNNSVIVFNNVKARGTSDGFFYIVTEDDIEILYSCAHIHNIEITEKL